MSSLDYSASTFCRAGAEGKAGEVLLDHFREFVGNVWESDSPRGMTLVLRPEVTLRVASDVVYFYTVEQLKKMPAAFYNEFKRTMHVTRCGDESEAALVNFGRRKRMRFRIFPLSKACTKAAMGKWFEELQLETISECVVCYEETGAGERMSSMCSICGAKTCLQCFIDIALDSDLITATMRAVRCPMCDQKAVTRFSVLCRDPVAGRALGEAHKEFTHFWSCYNLGDFSRAIRCDFAKMTAKMRDVIELDFEAELRKDLIRIEGNRKAEDFIKNILKTYPPLLRRALCGKATALPSADDSSAIASGLPKPARMRSDRCGFCQKVFWDKNEKKRAPKCGKCKRVLYCSSVCRKKHKAAHSLKCVAKATVKRKRKAAKRAAKLYGP